MARFGARKYKENSRYQSKTERFTVSTHFANKNLTKEIASLREIAEEIQRSEDPDNVRTPTPHVRSIISTMQSFQRKGEDLMIQINDLVGDLIGRLTELSSDPRLSEEQKKILQRVAKRR